MITLITGTPGAGKTLYAISKLLRELVGSSVKKTEPDGSITEVPRRIITNINGLLLDHEFIGPDVGGGLADWHLWAKPGDVICYDEVQKSWPPRANGSKVPDYIQGLETHRHMGVDFIILTQNPMLIDRNVTALVGRHLHVRRFGGLGAAIVYEWDHCSRSLLFSKSIAKAPFRYDKSVFKLYKSAELHTKPKTRVPTLAFVVLAAIGGAALAIPYAAERINRHGSPAASSSPASGPFASKSAPAAASVAGSSNPFEARNALMVAQAEQAAASAAAAAAALPYQLAELTLVGSMQFQGKGAFFFKGNDGALLRSIELEKLGYTVTSLSSCSVSLSAAGQTKAYTCPMGGVAPPKAAPPKIFDRLMSPSPVDPVQASVDAEIFRGMRQGF